MALATFIREVDLAKAALTRLGRQGVESRLGRRIQRTVRRYVAAYFSRIEAAMPTGEIAHLVAMASAGTRPSDRRKQRQLAQNLLPDVEQVIGGVVDAYTVDLETALIGPGVFAYYAAALDFRLAAAMAEGEGGYADSSTADPFDRPATLPSGDIRPEVAAWLNAQAAPVEAVAEAARARAAQLVTQMSTVSKRRIASAIADGIARGHDVPTIARAIQGRFHNMRLTRARLIALNETNEWMSRGAHEKAVKEGARQKRQVTMGDDRVTDGCRENGRAGWIGIDDAFPSGNMRTPRFPGCRCSTAYRRSPNQPPPAPMPAVQPITAAVLDAALAVIFARIPGVVYASGLALPPKDIAAIAATKVLVGGGG